MAACHDIAVMPRTHAAMPRTPAVIRAKAGIHPRHPSWLPAVAAMTGVAP
jgi:hypothetical protein